MSSRSDEKLTTLPLNRKPSRDFRSVLETIAPSETVLDPSPEDDDPDVYHSGWRDEMAAARKARNPFWTLCGKFVYERPRAYRKRCRACEDITRDKRDRRGRD